MKVFSEMKGGKILLPIECQGEYAPLKWGADEEKGNHGVQKTYSRGKEAYRILQPMEKGDLRATHLQGGLALRTQRSVR